MCLCRSGAPRPMCCVLFFPQFCAFCLQCFTLFTGFLCNALFEYLFLTMHIYSNVNFLYLPFSCSLCGLWGVVQFYAFLYVGLPSNDSSTMLIIIYYHEIPLFLPRLLHASSVTFCNIYNANLCNLLAIDLHGIRYSYRERMLHLLSVT